MIIFIFYLIYLFTLLLICKCSFSSKRDSVASFNVGILSLFLCTILLYIVQANYIDSLDFYFPDEEKFFNSSETLTNLTSVFDILIESFSNAYYSSNQLAVFLMGTAGHIFHNNSVLLQRLVIVEFSFLIPVFVYKLARFYVDFGTALKCAILFTLFSYALPYSCFLLRDIHVMFFSLIMLLLIHNDFCIKNIISQLIIITIVYFLRPESGVVVSSLFLYYIFIKKHAISKQKQVKFLKIVSILVFLISLKFVFSYLLMAFDGSEYYVNRTLTVADENNGALRQIYSLPFGVRNVVIGIYSQMSPVPFWKALDIGKIPFIGFLFMLNAIFWFFVHFIIVKYVFIKKTVKIPLILMHLYIFFVLFLCFASSEIAHRRLMCFYPIPYIIFIFIYKRIERYIPTEFLYSLVLYTVVGLIFTFMVI